MNTFKKLVTFFFLIGAMATANLAVATDDSAKYTYDDQGRLETILYTIGAITYTTTYAYDKEGNRISEVTTCTGC